MLYRSTRGDETVTSVRAVLDGLAPDGGLYMPSVFPAAFDWRSVSGLSFEETAGKIFAAFLDDFPDLPGLTRRSYGGRFRDPRITPIRMAGDTPVLELFHGPTCAFKDVALSFLPALMAEAQKLEGRSGEILILTATSGDTGKAAMEGFRDVPGIRILVFYPEGGVSPVQERQMTSQEGGNVRAAAIRGNFDDAQTAVKEVFALAARGKLPPDAGAALSSANSINIGRLIPQIVYYFTAYADLVQSGTVQPGEPVHFTVPTGNFGDILAGFFAKKLGLPVGKLLCASNANHILSDFLTTGVYDRNRRFLKTSSPSMDILISSNLERMLFLAADEDPAAVRALMDSLRRTGRYEAPASALKHLQEHFCAGWADEREIRSAIRRCWEDRHYLLDPHTAAAWAVAEKSGLAGPNVILATASPFKFPDTVLYSLGAPVPDDPFARLDALSALTGIPVPPPLAGLKDRPVRFTDVIGKEEVFSYVLAAVRKGELS